VNKIPAPLEEVLTLLSNKRTGSLGTIGEGKPFTSLTSFAFEKEAGNVIFLLSKLARHTKNIDHLNAASLLVESDERTANPSVAHPLDKPRVTITGTVRRVADKTEVTNCRTLFLSKNPESKQLLELSDFGFYILQPDEVYYVKGFGSVSRFAALKN